MSFPVPTTPQSAISTRGELAWRFILLVPLIVWVGGFTFYTAVVIRVGHAMYPDGETIGFLTREVTFWLNWIGLVSLALLAPIAGSIHVTRHEVCGGDSGAVSRSWQSR